MTTDRIPTRVLAYGSFALVVFGMLLTVVAQCSANANARAAVPAAVCDWDDEFASALGPLGEDPADWTVAAELKGGASGLTHPATVTASVSRQTPCGLVQGAVAHEWMHLQTLRAWGPDAAREAYRADPDRLERLADCGARFLGATYTPYLDQTGPCTPAEVAEARSLMGKVR